MRLASVMSAVKELWRHANLAVNLVGENTMYVDCSTCTTASVNGRFSY